MTLQSGTDSQPCRIGATGKASRPCIFYPETNTAAWGEIDIRNCNFESKN